MFLRLVQLEYVNPIAGLAMLVIGLFLVLLGYWVYGVTPAAVGIMLIIYYRKHLMQILGGVY
jgi:hypothetical protein